MTALRYRVADAVVIVARGWLDGVSGAIFASPLSEAFDNGHRPLVLDLHMRPAASRTLRADLAAGPDPGASP